MHFKVLEFLDALAEEVVLGSRVHGAGINEYHPHIGLACKGLKPARGPQGVTAGFGKYVSLKNERDGLHEGGLWLGLAKITLFRRAQRI